VSDDHPTVAVAWRHYPDPVAHPRGGLFALAAEAAPAGGPALFIDGRRYDGRLDPKAVSAAVRRSSA
jgi:hypothetical protein